MIVTCGSCVFDSHPYALKVMDDAGIVQGSVKFDQLECVFNTAQTGMGFILHSPYPKPIDAAARREPKGDPIGQVRFERRFCSDNAAQILPRVQILQAVAFGHDQVPRIKTFYTAPCFGRLINLIQIIPIGRLVLRPPWAGNPRFYPQSAYLFGFSEISLDAEPKSVAYCVRPTRREGRCARHETRGWDAVDAGFAKDDRKRSRTVKSCGPDAPMAGVKFSGSSRFLGMTVTNKLWSRRGEHGISRKPLRREGRSVSAEPVCSCAFSLSALHMRPRVQRAPGLPCALFSLGRERIRKTRADAVARMRRCAEFPPSPGGQGYRMWPRSSKRKASFHPARFSLPRRETVVSG
jgi:hypothetical protein